MCGIVAVLGRRPTRSQPEPSEILALLDQVLAGLGPDSAGENRPGVLAALSDGLNQIDSALRGRPGVEVLLCSPVLRRALDEATSRVEAFLAAVEADLDRSHTTPSELERLNAALVTARDALWALAVDRVRTAEEVGALAGDARSGPALDAYLAIAVALSGLDRLEVRGRDSAGLHVSVTSHGLDLTDASVAEEVRARSADPLFTSESVRVAGGSIGFVYKVAAEIGELGDNVADLRARIATDGLLARALSGPETRASVLAHTRWASVGIISSANAHPLNSEPRPGPGPGADRGPARPYAVAALNGDVDNHATLRARAGLDVDPLITTDAKVIPMLLSEAMAAGGDPERAFLATAGQLEGSVAVAAQVLSQPDTVFLAQRGSGQGLYVGLADDCFVVSSEAYGLVRETATYLRLDGDNGGQVVVLRRDGAGTTAGLTRSDYEGRVSAVAEHELVRAEVTTRDIDRQGHRHYLLKELNEAPESVRRTIRGRIATMPGSEAGRLVATLGEESIGVDLRGALARGAISRILVVGQGTAAVAGQAIAEAIRTALAGAGSGGPVVEALPATELSGFGLRPDMEDTLIVAVSQSGTTTDTNRTVEMVRARGATVVAIVNRRNSDLAARSDGVIYTSDGRDVEMSVASTKAFYSQVCAGVLLAAAVAEASGTVGGDEVGAMLAGLRALPAAMDQVLARSEEIARAAAEAPGRRYWAVVGSGPNRVTAAEVRIKLSELCYKSIACDTIEDKKHIDLSSEPLILVCAAGLRGPTADDVAKEIQIYRAHRALPVVIATAGTNFSAAAYTIEVPAVGGGLDFVLATMVGHLFGYHAALAIDAGAQPLREAQSVIREAVAQGGTGSDGRRPGTRPAAEEVLVRISPGLARPTRDFLAALAAGRYDGHLEASTASRLAELVRLATSSVPLDSYGTHDGDPLSPGQLLDDLAAALAAGVAELSRPIDAIKHQAKTVTVGISRSEDDLLRVPLVRTVLEMAPVLDRLAYRNLRQLVALDPAVASVEGFTRYRVDGDVGDKATIHVVAQGGTAAGLSSRTAIDPVLRGTKRGALDEREVTVAVGRSDGRSVILVPEVRGRRAVGLMLLHTTFRRSLPSEVVTEVLSGYRHRRYEALVNAVTETEPEFDPTVLSRLDVLDVLVKPVLELAEEWSAGPSGAGPVSGSSS